MSLLPLNQKIDFSFLDGDNVGDFFVDVLAIGCVAFVDDAAADIFFVAVDVDADDDEVVAVFNDGAVFFENRPFFSVVNGTECWEGEGVSSFVVTLRCSPWLS